MQVLQFCRWAGSGFSEVHGATVEAVNRSFCCEFGEVATLEEYLTEY